MKGDGTTSRMAGAVPQGNEETLSQALARYEKSGFTAQFSARPGAMLLCHTCSEEEPADQVSLKGLHRFEGMSDPDEMAALAALECPGCGAWGTLVLAFGPSASPEDREVLMRFMDDRRHSVIPAGL